MLTPSMLARKPVVKHVDVPAYDWESQQRWGTNSPLYAGKYTSASVQTFDNKGRPNDSRSDNND
jgi:hypothetical protein